MQDYEEFERDEELLEKRRLKRLPAHLSQYLF